LSLEAYLVLICLNNKDPKTLEEYTTSCRKIPVSIFADLIVRRLIDFNGTDINQLTFDNIKLGTSEMLTNLFPKLDINQLFNEFKAVYPKKVISNMGEERQLHLDKKRCIKLYEKIISPSGRIDLTIHNNLLEATRKMVETKSKSGSLGYLQLMGTYLHQQNYEAYVGEADSTEATNVDAV